MYGHMDDKTHTNITFVFDAIQPLQLTITPFLLLTIRPELLLSQHLCWWLLDNIYCYYTTYIAYKLHLLLSDLIYAIRQYILLLHHIHCL